MPDDLCGAEHPSPDLAITCTLKPGELNAASDDAPLDGEGIGTRVNDTHVHHAQTNDSPPEDHFWGDEA